MGLRPVSIGTLVLLEQIKHPFTEAAAVALSARDIARLVFILAQPDEAAATLRQSERAFDRGAFALARFIEPADLPLLNRAIEQAFATSLPQDPREPLAEALRT